MSMLSITDTLPYGIPLTGYGILENHKQIINLVHQDHGLDKNKKRTLTEMLHSPEVLDHLLAGVAGVLVAKAISSYTEMSKPARTLLSLAGFGIGNVIYNNLNERKFTTFDPHTGVSRVNRF